MLVIYNTIVNLVPYAKCTAEMCNLSYLHCWANQLAITLFSLLAVKKIGIRCEKSGIPH